MSHGFRLPSEAAPFYLVTQDGWRWPATSLEALFERFHRGRVLLLIEDGVPQLRCPPKGWRAYGMANLCLMDAQDEPVDLGGLLPHYRHHMNQQHIQRAAHPSFRRDPVEGVGRHRAGSMFRHPRTTPALRLAAGVLAEEGEPVFRGRRRNLPTVWDDFWTPETRSWKAHRATQWKERRRA